MTPYTRTGDFATHGTDRRAEKMNHELDLIAAAFASVGGDFTAVLAAIALKADIASPALTGTPTAPTPALGTDTTQIATMEALQDAIAAAGAMTMPSQAGHGPMSPLTTNGTTYGWDDDARLTYVLPLLGTNTGFTSMPTFDQINTTEVSTGLGTTGVEITRSSTLWVAFGRSASGSVATSPDCATWTLRAMTGSATWDLAADNASADLLAVANGATTVNKSTDGGATWSAATALPGNSLANPNVIGTSWLAPGTSNAYLSTDHGTSWSTEAAPWTTISHLFRVGGLFFACANGSATYWTSPTGLAGSWTSRSAPVVPFFWQSPDGSVSCAIQGAVGSQVYITTDGVTWSAVTGLVTHDTNGTVHLNLNGTWCAWSSVVGGASTHKAGITTLRYSARSVAGAAAGASALAATDGAGTYAVAVIGTDHVIPLSTTGAPTVLHRIT